VAGPLAAADGVAEPGHAVEHLVYLGDDVLPVDDQGGATGSAQGDMEHRPVLGHVDVLAGEHRRRALPQPGLLGQLNQQLQGLVGDAILGVVEEEPDRLGGHALPPGRVIGEEIPQVPGRDLLVVAGQSRVSGPLFQPRDGHSGAL